MDLEVQELLDKQQIKDVIARYCRACDRLDRKLLESVYWSDATDNHGTFTGDAAGAVDFILKSLDGMVTQHFIGNMLIEMQSPKRARAETYVNAFHQFATRFHGDEFMVGARYLDIFEKRGAEWRIKERTVAFDYSRTAPVTPTDKLGKIQNWGKKYPDDALYRLFGKAPRPADTALTAQDVIDKKAIHEVIMRYCRACDRLDMDLFATVYWPDATDDHGTYSGPASGMIAAAPQIFLGMNTQHFIGNVLIELESPIRARAESYVNAIHIADTYFGSQEFILGARYLDNFEKRGNEWRIKDRVVAYDYSQSAATTASEHYKNRDTSGKKYPDDLIYRSAGKQRLVSESTPLQEALDRQSIEDVLMRYCRGIDRLDRKMLETAYWSDAIDNHGAYNGDAPGFINWVLDALIPMKTQHFLGNFIIDFDSPTQARGETYVVAYHQISTLFGAEEAIVGARYIDKFEKRGDEWRIIARTVSIDYSRRAAVTESKRYDTIEFKGGRYPEDPVYRVYGQPSRERLSS